MKIILRLLLLALVCGLGFWLWGVLFPSPRKIALKKVNEIAAITTIKANDSNLARAGRAARLANLFAPNAQIVLHIQDLASRSLSGRNEIQQAALAGFSRGKSLKVQFFDITTTVGPNKQMVEVLCTAQVNVGSSKNFEVQELRFTFKKLDGHWLITRVETVKTLT